MAKYKAIDNRVIEYGKTVDFTPDTKDAPRFQAGDLVEIEPALREDLCKRTIFPGYLWIESAVYNTIVGHWTYTIERVDDLSFTAKDLGHVAPTKTIFRQFKDGSVIAIFPEISGTMDAGTCSSYMYVGQHASANVWGGQTIIDTTKPLKDEAKRLEMMRHLHGLGYACVEVKRSTYQMYETRKQQIQAVIDSAKSN